MAKTNVRMDWNPSFARDVMNSYEVMDVIDKKAIEVKRRADGIGSATYGIRLASRGKNRCHAFVYTDNIRAIRSNAKHNTLVKALG